MMKKKLALWMLALLVVLSGIGLFGAGPVSAAGPQGIQAGAPIDDAGNILITNQVAQAIADSGAGWVRVNFRLGPWTSDTAQFYSTYDTIVNRLRSKGLQVVGLLSNESWPGSQADWTAGNAENQGGSGYNSYIDGFGYMAGRVAAHFEGSIKYWEVWNEPNCWSTNPSPGVFEGCSYIYPSNFAALLGHVWTQMKYYNNLNVEVISGGVFGHSIGEIYTAGNSGADYISDTYYQGTSVGSWNWILANAGQYPLDHIGQHIYITQGGTVSSTNLQNYLSWVRNAYTAYEGSGTAKKTFITEIGWTTDSVSQSVQASNVTTTYNVMKSTSYVASTLWFFLKDEPGLNYGIFKSTGFTTADRKTGWTNFRNSTAYEGKLSNGTTNTGILNYFNGHGGIATNGSPYDNGGTAYVHWWDYGYVQDCDGGSIGQNAIMSSSAGTFQVMYGFWQTYLQGSNHSHLQFPLNDEYAWNGGTRQDFQGGYMTWNAANGVQVF